MPFYSLGQQGFYDKFANAGAGIRNTLGTVVDLYNTYKPGGLEDQRRAELAMKQAQSKGSLDYMAAEKGLVGAQTQQTEQQTGQQGRLFDNVTYPQARQPLDLASLAGEEYNLTKPGSTTDDTSKLGTTQPDGTATPGTPGDQSNGDGSLPQAAGGDLSTPGSVGAAGPTPKAVGGVQDEGQPGAAPVAPPAILPNAPAPMSNNAISDAPVAPGAAPAPAASGAPALPLLGADPTLQPGAAAPAPASGGALPLLGSPAAPAAALPTAPAPGAPPVPGFSYDTTRQAIAQGRSLPYVAASAVGNTLIGASDLAGKAIMSPLAGVYHAFTDPIQTTGDNFRRGVDYLTGGILEPGRGAASSAAPTPPAAPAAAAPPAPAPVLTTPPVAAPAAPAASTASSTLAAPAPGTPGAPPLPLLGEAGAPPPTPAAPQRALAWNELSPQVQGHLVDMARQQNPTITPAMVRETYDTQVVPALTGMAARNVPITPDALQGMAFMGIRPSTVVNPNGTYDAIKMGDTVADRLGGAGGSQMVMRGADGIPYTQFLRLPDPATGKLTLREIPIPPEARGTASGLSAGQQDKMNAMANEYLTHEQPKTFFGQINPKMRAIEHMMPNVNSNNFKDMDLLNSYAGITRPGAVVRDSTIETDLENAGVPNELARKYSSAIGRGGLSAQDRREIAQAAKISWQGYYDGTKQELGSAVNRVANQFKVRPEDLAPLMFGGLLDDPLSDGGTGDGSAPGAAPSKAPSSAPEVSSADDYAKLPPGTTFTNGGKTYIKPR